LPPDGGASSLAIAQAGAMLARAHCADRFRKPAKGQWPRPRDLAVTVFANALMSAIVLPMRGRSGLATLVEQITTGVAVYAVVVLGSTWPGCVASRSRVCANCCANKNL
jgi:small-conductance mechanosensitive channel